jgi:hypothetical protein
MAEAEVNISYQTAPVSALGLGLAVLLPLGAVYLLWSSIVVSIAATTGVVIGGRAMLFMVAQILVWCGFAGVFFLTRDKQVFLSKDGISLPFFVLPSRIPRT